MENHELISKYMESHALLSKGTNTVRFYILTNLSKSLEEEEKSFLSLLRSDLLNYIIKQKESNKWKKQGTIVSFIIIVRQFYRFLVNEKFIKDDDNPAKNLKAPSSRNVAELHRISAPELRHILKIVEHPDVSIRDKLVFYIAITSGLRASEICSIELSNIDLTKNLIYIPKDSVKGQYREKLVPICSKRTEELLRLFIIKFPPKGIYLFDGKYAGEKLSRHSIYRIMKDIFDYAYPYKGSWKKPSGSHIARHTFASRWIETGGEYAALKAIMGWTSFAQFNRYVEVSPEYISKSSRKVSNRLLKV